MVATRWVPILALTSFGVFAPLAEVNAGRFCRKATACPCVPAECVPVVTEPYLPTGHVQAGRIVTLSVSGPTIYGKIYTTATGATAPSPLANTDIAINVLAGDGTALMSNPQYHTSSTGTFSVNQYTTLSTNGSDFYVEFSRVGGATISRHGPFTWGSSNTFQMFPWVP